MTYIDNELYNVLDISHLKIKVGHPNGTEAFISKIGNLKLSNDLILYDVLVIPEYCVTLICVHKLAKENKIIVAFDESRYYFLNLRNILGIGNQCEGLYYYNDQGIKSNHSVLDYKCHLSQYDWHCRLGHPAKPVLVVLKGSLQIDNMNKNVYCETCQRAKQTREPFPLSHHVSKSLDDLVYLDLWGPYKVTSSEGFRYFLTVMEDYTRAVWVYLIKSKDEVLQFITIFYNLIENQFKRKIKVFRSDNGTEFVNQIVNSFCADKRNIYQTSRAYTPQQNRFSSSVLNGKSPYEMIYKKTPSLSHLRVFGCLCFATIVNNNEKFGSRVYSNLNSDNMSQSASSNSSVSGRDANTVDFLVNSGNDADSSNDIFTTQDEGATTLEENIFSEGNLDQNSSTSQGVQHVRKSSRQSVFPRNYNDFVVESKVKYGLEKYVGYSKLNSEKFCFVTQLNKHSEPKSYFEASKFPYWTDVINQEMDALLNNETWKIIELPTDRKAIGNKDFFLSLLVYVDDISITGNNVSKIELFLKSKFMIKDLGKLKYCFGIEVVDTNKGVCLNQRKYVLDLLSDYASDNDHILDNITDYQKLIVSSKDCFQDIEISQKLPMYRHLHYQEF
ncbi:ribonuclease H-like domain-containing protein, partial [Tanacetum coccineum]